VENESATQVSRKAIVETSDGSRYINKLCKHFTHRVPAQWSEHQGLVNFAMGTCDMLDDGQSLSFVCKAENESDLNEIIETIQSHFDRFALKDQLIIKEWI
jgi:hypothetical protein